MSSNVFPFTHFLMCVYGLTSFCHYCFTTIFNVYFHSYLTLYTSLSLSHISHISLSPTLYPYLFLSLSRSLPISPDHPPISLALPTLPLPSLQEEQLNEILAEVRALKAVVMAQGQRIDILERQLTRIEDGDV